jgi:hypothetical protein
MHTGKHPNRRTSYRFNINVIGKIYIEKKDKKIEEDIHIINISYNGLQVVFAGNDFLFDFFESLDDKEIIIRTSFEYMGKPYSFLNSIFWVRLFDVAERNFYILTTLKFRDKDKFEKELLDILYLIDMQNIYLGKARSVSKQ